MKTLKLLRPDEEYTNLALLLSDQCPHTIKIAEFQGTDKTLFRNRAEMGGSLLKQLQDVYDLIETYGTGIPKIMAQYEKESRVPIIEVTDNAFKITLPNMNILQTTCASQDKPALSQTEERAMRLLEENSLLTRKELEQAFAISQSA